MSAWLAVIGIGEEGWSSLSGAARGLIEAAELVVGGERHLALVPRFGGERLTWKSPLTDTLPEIERRRGRRVAVLASGDPLCYGVGALLARCFGPDAMVVLPSPSAFSLAAAQMLWPLESCTCFSLHGRPLEKLMLHLAPGARLLALSEDGTTPAKVARLLSESGWGGSSLHVFEHLGGPEERRRDGPAAQWGAERVADLNVLALECRPSPEARPLSRRAGLPDNAFRHDGLLTKRAIRAATLAALAPLRGELLWDIGAGSGSIAIEWLRSERFMRAIAIERAAPRAAFIAESAARLGVPEIEIVQQPAPAALAALPRPDAIFIGGGVSEAAIWDAAWDALKPGGRLVANAVTLDGEAELFRRHRSLGGELTRLAVTRAEDHRFWRPAMAVAQLFVVKPQ
ncbi:MAG TPA: precorrin-6y C5,15-methyltransferase (decarboxylating) subunit CbiE [Stellaceae bacterium]|nr:precorrin-6y C5,15-methyltransferase (decarboxylating) subunit CbiE [Stellaceae bacterium]